MATSARRAAARPTPRRSTARCSCATCPRRWRLATSSMSRSRTPTRTICLVCLPPNSFSLSRASLNKGAEFHEFRPCETPQNFRSAAVGDRRGERACPTGEVGRSEARQGVGL
ncbi:hypothetical protein ERY430_40272 [Erythrobacter sp. EC-HK427]|nr:hypothetical protein ERY430_40272 [Erythrobacter sp. EC-HK427]